MKKFLLTFAIIVAIGSFYNTASAQRVSVNINLNSQPAWGPSGYDYVGYYYFPDIDCYYDVNAGMFYYYNTNRWISDRYLPDHYRTYDLYSMYKVVINTSSPWNHSVSHRRDYARYRGYRNQVVIRDSRDNRYDHPRRNTRVWYNDRRHVQRPDHRYGHGRNDHRNDRYTHGNSGRNDRHNNNGGRYDQHSGRNDHRNEIGGRRDNSGRRDNNISQGRGNNSHRETPRPSDRGSSSRSSRR